MAISVKRAPVSVIFHLEKSHIRRIQHLDGNKFRAVVDIDVPLEVLDDFCLKFKEQNLKGIGKNE
jgi:hypothetical protein